jgi:hypothetical protein
MAWSTNLVIIESSVPDWAQRYNLRVMDALNATATVDLANAASVTLGNYANDAAAATGGVLVGGLYRNGSTIQVRVT